MNITFDHIAPHLRESLEYRAGRAARARLTDAQYRGVVWRLIILGLAMFWAAVIYGMHSLFV